MRELQPVLERAVILGRGKSLELGELGQRFTTASSSESVPRRMLFSAEESG